MNAFTVNLPAIHSEGGSASATVDLGSNKRFMAWGSVTMVDPISNFDRDNAFALDIFTVDGNLTSERISGGDHWGPSGSGDNVFDGAVTGFGRRIQFWLRTLHSADLDTFGVGIVLVLE